MSDSSHRPPVEIMLAVSFFYSLMTKLLLPLAFYYLFFTTGIFGILLCENGLFCVSDGDCQIGNHCIEIVDGQKNSTRCVPRDDLDDTYYCSLSNKSCECE